MPQPAVMVAESVQSGVAHVVQTDVVETTAAQPETETIETVVEVVSWARTWPMALLETGLERLVRETMADSSLAACDLHGEGRKGLESEMHGGFCFVLNLGGSGSE